MKDDFSERFAALCELRELTCVTLAEKAGVAQSMSSRWMNGVQKPRDRADIVKRVFGMSLAQFYSVNVAEVRRKVRERDRKRAA